MSMKNCEDCEHFDEYSTDEDSGSTYTWGRCLRYPPVWTPGEAAKHRESSPAREWHQPAVESKDSCGEFVPRVPEYPP